MQLVVYLILVLKHLLLGALLLEALYHVDQLVRLRGQRGRRGLKGGGLWRQGAACFRQAVVLVMAKNELVNQLLRDRLVLLGFLKLLLGQNAAILVTLDDRIHELRVERVFLEKNLLQFHTVRFLGLLFVIVLQFEQFNVLLVFGLDLHQGVSFPHDLFAHPVLVIA